MYRKIIQQFIALLPLEDRYYYFQQDGATANTANNTIEFLREFFDDRLISWLLWLPCPPDHSPLDFFLWGFLKDRVFSSSQNLDELCARITDEINSIYVITLRKVFRNMIDCVRARTNADGGQFQHLL